MKIIQTPPVRVGHQNLISRVLVAAFTATLMLFAGLGFAAPASASHIDSINLTSMIAPDDSWGGKAAASAINSAGQLVVLVQYHRQGFGMERFYALETFDTDGTQNLSFGNSGWVRLPYTSSNTLEILSGDRILVVGGYYDLSRSEPRVARIDVFNNAGAHDGTFGSDGIVYVASANPGGDIYPEIRQISVLPNGKIAVLMNYRDISLSYEFVQVLQARNSDGSLDDSFSENGEVVLEAPEGSRSLQARSFSVTDDGFVIAVDYQTEPDGKFCFSYDMYGYDDYGSIGGSQICYPVDAPRVDASQIIAFDGWLAANPTPSTTPSSSDSPTAEPTPAPSEAFTYTTDVDNNVTVTGCVGTCPADLVIPETLGGNPVTAIGDNAFKGAGLSSVVFPDSLVSIGTWAFENNSLTAVTLPDSLTTLNAGAFYINSLVSVEVPSSVTTVGDYAFAKNSLTAITFKGNAPSEAGSVFDNNTNLAYVDVAFGSTGWGATFDGITVRVGDAPFTYTTDADNNVTVTGYAGTVPVDLVIPATLGGNPVTAIGGFAFTGAGLTSLALPSSITGIDYGAFYYNDLTSLTLPASVTSIGGYAFEYNQLTNVTIPAHVTSLGENAFGWNSLTSVTFAGNAPSVGTSVFNGNKNLVAVDITYATTGWGSTFSDVAVRVNGAPAAKPASAPKIRSVKVGNGQVRLGIWAPRTNGGSEIIGYEYTVDGGTTWVAVDASSTALSLVITGLDNATRYTVKVRAINSFGGGAASNGKSFTPRTVAGAPVITSLTGLSAKIKVEIEAPAFDGGSKITRYAYSINEGTWHSWNAGGTGTPQFITGLKAGVSCSVRLRAYTAAGWGAISEATIATPTRK